MLKKMPIVASALAVAVCLTWQLLPARATAPKFSDRVIIKNELDYGTTFYGIVKSVGWQTGCLAHRLQFNDTFLFRPERVEFKIYRTHADCGSKTKPLYSASMKYYAPKTTYLITGSPDLKNFRITEEH